MNKVLISGGAGFIGCRLASSLAKKGIEVLVLDNLSPQIHGEFPHALPTHLVQDGIRFVRGDVSRLEDWESHLPGVDAVVHLAAETGTAQSMYQIGHYHLINCQGTALLLEALSRNKGTVKKIVLSSSRSVYGEGAYLCDCRKNGDNRIYPGGRLLEDLNQQKWEPRCPHCHKPAQPTATSEESKIAPASIYASTKYSQEEFIRIGSQALGIDSTLLRLQNVYGEGQSLNNPYTGILSIFSTRIRRNLSLPIFEDGLESRDFVHVSDVVEAISKALVTETPHGRVYNVGSGRPTTVFEVANLLVEKLKGKAKPHVTGEFRVGDIRHCYADLTRIQKELGFIPQVTLSEGLESFVDWVLREKLPEDNLEKANAELRSRGLMK